MIHYGNSNNGKDKEPHNEIKLDIYLPMSYATLVSKAKEYLKEGLRTGELQYVSEGLTILEVIDFKMKNK